MCNYRHKALKLFKKIFWFGNVELIKNNNKESDRAAGLLIRRLIIVHGIKNFFLGPVFIQRGKNSSRNRAIGRNWYFRKLPSLVCWLRCHVSVTLKQVLGNHMFETNSQEITLCLWQCIINVAYLTFLARPSQEETFITHIPWIELWGSILLVTLLYAY